MPVFTLDEARAELGRLLPLLDEMVAVRADAAELKGFAPLLVDCNATADDGTNRLIGAEQQTERRTPWPFLTQSSS